MSTAALSATRTNFGSLTTTVPGRVLVGLAATAVVAAAAHIAIPLPFTPVPLTLQPLAVLGVGLALGPVDGFVAMLAYLAEGALGLPVFSPTGPGGLAQLLGPTGGFLMAYPLVAAIVGGLTQLLARVAPRFVSAAVAGLFAVTLLFVSGAAWFMHLTHLSLQIALAKTVLPFRPGELIKILAAAGIYSTLARSTRI